MRQSNPIEDVTAWVVETSAGFVAWLATPHGVRTMTLPQRNRAAALERLGVTCAADARPARDDLARMLVDYFDGEPVELGEITLDLARETSFQAAVRRVVRSIPRGSTMTYGEVAAAAGHPGAARAVGQVMATNPVPPLVPCHRVVASDGLGGFGSGLDVKRKMLTDEGWSCGRS